MLLIQNEISSAKRNELVSMWMQILEGIIVWYSTQLLENVYVCLEQLRYENLFFEL